MRPQKTKAWWKQDWLWTVYVISPWVAYPFLVILRESEPNNIALALAFILLYYAGYVLLWVRGYSMVATVLSACSHMGHLKVSNSCPGLSGTLRASSICVPHFGHSGRIVSGCKRIMAHAPNIRREHDRTLSHRRLQGRPSAGDGAQSALIEQIANH